MEGRLTQRGNRYIRKGENGARTHEEEKSPANRVGREFGGNRPSRRRKEEEIKLHTDGIYQKSKNLSRRQWTTVRTHSVIADSLQATYGNPIDAIFNFRGTFLMGDTSAGAGSRAAHGPGDLITAGDRFRGGTLRTHRANSRSTRRPPLGAHAPAVQCSTGSRAGNFRDRVILSPAEIGTRPENSSRTNVRLGTARAAHLWGAIT